LEGRSLANRIGVGKRTSVSLLPRKNPLLSREAMSSILSAKEIKEAIKDLPEWDVEGKAIVRVFEFDDFEQAIDFVNGVAELAEDADHHPDMDIRYNKVRVILSTHSKGGITESDFDLAERLDTLVDA
jgi:4a-hydroxytetrahydrobiopterin dehydratase